MRRITSSLVAAGAVAGIAGAIVAYQSTVSAPTAARPVVAPAAVDPTPAVTTRLLPCDEGTRLVKGVCVRTKHRVVVRETAPAPAAASTRQAGERPRTSKNDDRPRGPRGATQPRDDDSHESEDHESDDHESDDHESDDHESEDHESEDHESEDHEDD